MSDTIIVQEGEKELIVVEGATDQIVVNDTGCVDTALFQGPGTSGRVPDPITSGIPKRFLTDAGTWEDPGTASGQIPQIGTSTDNAIATWNGPGGDALQNSLVTVDDSGNVAVPNLATVDGVDVSELPAAIAAKADQTAVTALQMSVVQNTTDITSNTTKLAGIEAGAAADQNASEVPSTPVGNLAATDVQAALAELDTEKADVNHTHPDATTTTPGFLSAADKTKLDGIENGATGDQTAAEVSLAPSGNLTSTNVQAALDEHQGDLDALSALVAAGSDDQTAAEVPVTPVGNISATDVQAALAELDTEKAPLSALPGTFTGIGSTGLVPDPGAGAADRVLLADGTWAAQSGSGGGTDDQTAAEVPVTPSGNLASTNAQAALLELQGDIDALNVAVAAGSDDQTAVEVPYSNATSGLTATQVQDAIDELDATLDTATAKLAGIEVGATADQIAAEVPFTSVGNISATDVQGALAELDTEKADVNHTHPDATTTTSGFLSGADKTKLDGVETGATADQIASEVPVTPAGNLTSTDVQSALQELQTELDGVPAPYVHPNHSGDVTSVADGATTIQPNVVDNTKLADVPSSTLKGRTAVGAGDPTDLTALEVRTLLNVEDGATADQTASEVPVTPAGNLTSTDVQAALQELQADIDASGGTDDQTATEVPFTPAGNIAATDVQAALVELDTEKAAVNHTHPDATTTVSGFMSAADKTKLDGVETGATADQVAGEVPVTPVGNLTSTDVQAALQELQADIDASGGTDDQTAAEVAVTPAGNLTSTDVQAALLELQGDIDSVPAPYVHPNHSGDVVSVADGATTIQPDVVDNTKLANVPTATLKGRDAAGTGDPTDLTAAEVLALLGVESGAAADQVASEVPVTPAGNLASTDVQAALVEHQGDIDALTAAVAAGSDDQTAAEVAVTPSGNLTSTDVQAALVELQGDIDAFVDTDNQTAAEVPFTPTGNIAATDVQAALAELDTEKADVNHTHPDATTTVPGFMSAADKTKLDGVEAGATADQVAGEVPVTPAGNLTSTDVQAALLELQGDLDGLPGPYVHPNHSGDVVSAGDGATTIQPNVVDNAKLADVPTATLKGRDAAGTGDPTDLTATEVRTLLNVEDGATADQTAGEVAVTPSGNLTSTDVQAALLELQADIDASGGTDDQVAAEVPFTPTGGIAATDVQAAIAELDAEKLNISAISVFSLGTNGLVPGPGSIAGRFLRDDATFAFPAASSTSSVPAGNLAATNVQAALDELDSEKSDVNHTHPDATTTVPGFMSAADKTKLDGVEAGATADQVASEVPVTPAGNLASTDVQAALVEHQVDIDALNVAVAAGSDDQTAAEVPVTPAGNLTSTDTQAALLELQGDIDALPGPYVHPNHSGDVVSVADGATTIQPDVVDNTKLANVAANTLKGNNTGSAADPDDLSVAQVLTMLGVETGAAADQNSDEVPHTPVAPLVATDVAAALLEIVENSPYFRRKLFRIPASIIATAGTTTFPLPAPVLAEIDMSKPVRIQGHLYTANFAGAGIELAAPFPQYFVIGAPVIGQFYIQNGIIFFSPGSVLAVGLSLTIDVLYETL